MAFGVSLTTEPIAYSKSYFGAGDGPIIYSQMTCGGWERDISQCTKAEVFEFTCSREQVAGVLCGYGEKQCAIIAQLTTSKNLKDIHDSYALH